MTGKGEGFPQRNTMSQYIGMNRIVNTIGESVRMGSILCYVNRPESSGMVI